MKKVRIGAVNWDASLPRESYFGFYQTRSLSQAKYREWTPYYATVTDDERVIYYARTPEEYEREMRYAIDAGIDYFAFVWYPTEGALLHEQTAYSDCSHRVHELNYARHMYGRTSLTDKLGMCAIIASHPFTDGDLRELYSAFEKPYYEKIDGRPLLYVYGGYRREIIEKIHKGCRDRGIPAPFTVPMVAEYASSDGTEFIDALSAYTVCASGASSHRELIDFAIRANSKRLDSGLPVIPTFSVGWNPSPRIERTTPWTASREGISYYPAVSYAPRATDEELYEGAERFAEFVSGWNPESFVGHVLTFAWNEFEEGGYICPTYTKDGGISATRVEIFAKIAAHLREKLV